MTCFLPCVLAVFLPNSILLLPLIKPIISVTWIFLTCHSYKPSNTFHLLIILVGFSKKKMYTLYAGQMLAFLLY